MLVTTKGIVLRTLKYSETSVIADILTESYGLRSYLANGVRARKASISPGLLQVMMPLEFIAYFREDKDLHRLREARAMFVFRRIPFDFHREACGMFLAEVTRKTLLKGENHPSLFHFLVEMMRHLDSSPHPVANVPLAFLLRLTGFLGFHPAGRHTAATPWFDLQEGTFTAAKPAHGLFLPETEAALADTLLDIPLEEVHFVRIAPEVRRQLLRQLLCYYRLHMEHLPEIHTHAVLESVLR
jgi:DNA repair protein RecO (recombination protein O)